MVNRAAEARERLPEIRAMREAGKPWHVIAQRLGWPPGSANILRRVFVEKYPSSKFRTLQRPSKVVLEDDDFSKEFMMKITAEQRRLFWRLFQRACYVHDVPRHHQDDYRHGLIEQACGKRSLQTINTTDEFDAVLLATARAACDLEMIDKLLGSRMERWAFRICTNIRMITGNDHISRTDLIAYCEGILTRKYGQPCHIQDCADWWMNLTEETIEFLVKSTSVAARRREGKVRHTTKRA